MVALTEKLKIIAQTLDSEQQNAVVSLVEKISQHSKAKEKTLVEKDQEIAALNQQLSWFKRQLFGQKSEKRDSEDNPYQHTIVELLKDLPPAPKAKDDKQTISYQRGKQKKNALDGSPNDSGLRFNKDVPVKEIEITPPELKGDDQENYEIIRYEYTYRLAQQSASYVVLKYKQPVLKKKSTQTLKTCAPPRNVIDKSIADVSFMAGLLVDKFVYHLPLYRQHQRLEHSGIVLARSTLTNIVARAIELMRPIYNSQHANTLRSKVMAIDETPIKSGRVSLPGKKKGKLKQGYFWPLYGDQHEVCFTYSESRGTQHLFDQLGDFAGTILSDGYCAYNRFTEAQQATLANCWAHGRRKFEEIQAAFPEESAIALAYIGRLYEFEAHIKKQALSGKKALAYRQENSQPVVEAFFTWCFEQHARIDVLPKEGLLEAVAYVRNRETELKVFLNDPAVAIDTNHVERGLRVIPMGKKNWLFCWTEIGAELVGIIQSLLVTCRLHQVNPYDYLVDVLQRVDRHPASAVAELTPRLWKEKFADNPLRSDAYSVNL
jgi:transposase